MDARLKELTKEQLEILNLACDGKSSEEIAAVLGMTHGAFQKNAQTINRKLGIENLPEADRKREIHRLCAAIEFSTDRAAEARISAFIGVEGGLSIPSFGGEFGRGGGSLEGHSFPGALGGAVLFVGASLVPLLVGLKGTTRDPGALVQQSRSA